MNDSFFVVYRKPINGYKVKAVVKFDNNYLSADISFKKGKKQFTLHTTSFGDTCYSKGWWGYAGKNEELYRSYKGKTIMADYPEIQGDRPQDVPFFFKDMDFDNTKELVIVHYTCAAKQHDEYDIYRIVDGVPLLLSYPPFREKDKEGKYVFRMSDYADFDYKAKTISCPYPEGAICYKRREVYGLSKKKDSIVIHGKTYYFNH